MAYHALHTQPHNLQHEAIVAQMRNFIDTHQVVCAGPFIYAYVEEVCSSLSLSLSLSLSISTQLYYITLLHIHVPGYTECEVFFEATDAVKAGSFPEGGVDSSGQ